MARSKYDPNYFNSVILQAPKFWGSKDSPEPQYAGQVEWCRAVVDYHTVCIETGNMLGKDYWVARLAMWWLWTRKDALVIIMGPGQTTLCSITWKEIRRAVENCPYWKAGVLPARLSNGVKASPAFVKVSPGHEALGFSTTTVERASGHHSPNLLVIVEEASGVDDHVWEAIDSLGANKLVAIGNPLRAQCGFARLCDRAINDARDGIPKHQAVKHFNVPSTAAPHAKMEASPFGMACLTWLEGMRRKWGEKSAWFLSHVLAIRPKVGGENLVEIAWLDYLRAQARPNVSPDHPVIATRRIAVDLSEGVGRDSTCILVRDDWGVLEVIHGAEIGLEAAADRVSMLATKWRVPHAHISFDALGVGKSFPNHLAKHHITAARPYRGSAAPMDPNAFANIRTEAAWKCRLRLDPMHMPTIGRPHDGNPLFYFTPGTYLDELCEQLRPLTYQPSGTGIELLRKQDWCEILGRSPDVADAFIQSFAFA